MDEQFRKAFEHFDANKSGFLTPDELYEAMHKLGLETTMDEVHAMITEGTRDEEKKYVDYEEFMMQMKMHADQ
jgi:Ca2+-binding EF-hand superfamily protein